MAHGALETILASKSDASEALERWTLQQTWRRENASALLSVVIILAAVFLYTIRTRLAASSGMLEAGGILAVIGIGGRLIGRVSPRGMQKQIRRSAVHTGQLGAWTLCDTRLHEVSLAYLKEALPEGWEDALVLAAASTLSIDELVHMTAMTRQAATQ